MAPRCRRIFWTRSGRSEDVSVVSDIRGYGLLAAIDIHAAGAPGKRGHALQKQLFDNGLHLKATGDCVIIAPPLIAGAAAYRHDGRLPAQDPGGDLAL